jgi:hypothetical protein
MIVLPPSDPRRTGGGGTVVEVLLALTTVATAALAALVIGRPLPQNERAAPSARQSSPAPEPDERRPR